MTTQEINATDEAIELAKEHDIDLGEVKGSGAKESGQPKRILVSDVRKLIPDDDPSSSAAGFGTKGYSGPQPWDDGDVDQGEEISHTRPIIGAAAGGAHVTELVRLLHKLGYQTPALTGDNPFSILGPAEMAAVQAFRRDYGVVEDPAPFGGEVNAAAHIGPWTWEALYRAAE